MLRAERKLLQELEGISGARELSSLCSNARRVHEVCELLGIGFAGYPILEEVLEEELEELGAELAPDGAWILPEEV